MRFSWSYVVMAVLVSLAAVFVTVSAQGEARYCAYNQQHTMCKYTGPAQNCSFIRRGINLTSHDQILYLHNLYRSRVAGGFENRGSPGPQPAAANMHALRWDPELERISQRWADQCILASDQNRDIPDSYGYVGQNTFAFVEYRDSLAPESSQPEQRYWQDTIDTWYNEVNNFDSSTVGSYQYNANNGRYTQLVYANTTHVGCAFSLFNTSNNRVIRFHVCNYGSGGNRRNLPIYQRTQPAQACSVCEGRCQGYLCVRQNQNNNQFA